jgi:hypothetical protein
VVAVESGQVKGRVSIFIIISNPLALETQQDFNHTEIFTIIETAGFTQLLFHPT